MLNKRLNKFSVVIYLWCSTRTEKKWPCQFCLKINNYNKHNKARESAQFSVSLWLRVESLSCGGSASSLVLCGCKLSNRYFCLQAAADTSYTIFNKQCWYCSPENPHVHVCVNVCNSHCSILIRWQIWKGMWRAVFLKLFRCSVCSQDWGPDL